MNGVQFVRAALNCIIAFAIQWYSSDAEPVHFLFPKYIDCYTGLACKVVRVYIAVSVTLV